MSKKHTVPATDEAWETGQLGRNEEFVEVFDENIEAKLDKALELKPISIRLQESLIEDIKIIAKLHGIGYQPLMRQVLTRFADCEKKKILRDAAIEQQRRAGNKKDSSETRSKRKAA